MPFLWHSLAFLVVLLQIAFYGAAPQVASAHPGRLAQDGCHWVHKRWVYKSGQVLEPNTRHCHRKFGFNLELDGKELLEEPDDTGTHQRRPDPETQ